MLGRFDGAAGGITDGAGADGARLCGTGSGAVSPADTGAGSGSGAVDGGASERSKPRGRGGADGFASERSNDRGRGTALPRLRGGVTRGTSLAAPSFGGLDSRRSDFGVPGSAIAITKTTVSTKHTSVVTDGYSIRVFARPVALELSFQGSPKVRARARLSQVPGTRPVSMDTDGSTRIGSSMTHAPTGGAM